MTLIYAAAALIVARVLWHVLVQATIATRQIQPSEPEAPFWFPDDPFGPSRP